MGNRLNLDSAQKFSENLIKTAEIMETETENINSGFKYLGDTFRDQNYNEFAGEINLASSSINKVIEDIRSLNRSFVEYVRQMGDLLR